jgi:hypothetical protein
MKFHHFITLLMILVIVAIGCFGCKHKDIDNISHKDSNPKSIYHYDTAVEVKIQIDTLVIMITIDSLLQPKIDTSASDVMFTKMGDWEIRPMELFKYGKTSDTIYRYKTIYY